MPSQQQQLQQKPLAQVLWPRAREEDREEACGCGPALRGAHHIRQGPSRWQCAGDHPCIQVFKTKKKERRSGGEGEGEGEGEGGWKRLKVGLAGL